MPVGATDEHMGEGKEEGAAGVGIAAERLSVKSQRGSVAAAAAAQGVLWQTVPGIS